MKDIDRIPMVNQLQKFCRTEKKASVAGKEKSQAGKTLVAGYVNQKKQKNCGCTGKPGNHEGQLFYAMKCLECGFEYEANGCDVWLRRCPKCATVK